MRIQSPAVTFKTPIDDAYLSLASLEGEEELSQPFDFVAEWHSRASNINPETILGKPFVFTLSDARGKAQQRIHGVAVEFTQGQQDLTGVTAYTVRLRPEFWLLSLTSTYRVFQNKSVPDIVATVFASAGYTAYRNACTQHYPPVEYAVQYGETTMHFVSRLLEEAGIFYFFEHTDNGAVLVLADDASNYPQTPGAAAHLRWSGVRDETEIEVSLEQRLVPTSYEVSDFNFTAPATPLRSTSSGGSKYKLTEYPAKYGLKGQGDAIAGLRLSAAESEARLLRGSSAHVSFHAGHSFSLEAHHNPTANIAWTVLRMRTVLNQKQYRNEFTAFPARVTFRPQRRTPRPRIHGTQTAVVTGKPGEDVWTDRYGRVKVKFHWDASGASDDTTSCWVRVAQLWAGASWGGIFTPRVGTEVVVTFLDGDPDQPLIVGAVYNATHTPPYTLPDQQTKTALRTRSLKGGDGFNELSFDDRAGAEQVLLQAQQDLNLHVTNGNYGLNVAKGNEAHSVQGTRAVTVNGQETHTNKAGFAQQVTGDFTLRVSGNLIIDAGGSISIRSGASLACDAAHTLTLSSALDVGVSAQTEIALKAGASATLESAGQTTVRGAVVELN